MRPLHFLQPPHLVRMGSCCCRPEFRSTDDIARARHLDGSGGPPDYPQAARDFTAIGAPDFAIFCWLAADRPLIAERVYERSGFYLLDNLIGSRIPVWRMITGVKTGDVILVDEGRDEYMRVMGGHISPWLARTLSLI